MSERVIGPGTQAGSVTSVQGARWVPSAVAVSLVSIATATLVVVGAQGFLGLQQVVCVALGIWIATPVAIRLASGTFDLFEPAVIIAGVYFIYFVFAPLVRFWTDDLFFLGRDFEPDYLRGFAAVAVAVTAMWAGYALPVGPEPGSAEDVDPAEAAESARRGRRLAWALVVAALTGMMLWARVAGRSVLTFFLPGLLRATGDPEGGVDIPYLFLAVEWFIPALTLLIALGGLRGRVRRVAAVLLVTVVYVSIAYRYRIVVLWLAVGMATFLRAGRRPRVLSLLVPGAVAFVFAGWVSQARAFFVTAGAVGSLRFDLRTAVLNALADTRIFETFAAVSRVFPDFIGFAGVTPIVYPALLPIPRFLWPGKPLPEWLYAMGTSIGTAPSSTAGAAVPHFGEFYVAFGFPGVAVGMFVYGAATKWLWRWFRAAPSDPWHQAIFAVNAALIFLTIIRGYLAQIVMEWCFVVLPALAIMTLARRGAARAHARSLAAARA